MYVIPKIESGFITFFATNYLFSMALTDDVTMSMEDTM